jgi:hypothetical protein
MQKTLKNKRQTKKIFVVILILISLLIGASCSNVGNDTSENTSDDVNPTEEEAVVQPDHAIDPNPDPLDPSSAVLSLDGYGAVGALTDEDLTMVDMLTYAAQDEYLAHGEYADIIETFGNRTPYANIMRSEETHLAFLEEVFQSYGLSFPDDTSKDHLVTPTDLLEAAQIGVKAEIDNIAMYEKFLTYDLPENIMAVFTALRDGSVNHLTAFERQVARLSK